MADATDFREVMGCTCRRARRTTRQLTLIFDRTLAPSGLTANQFELLTNLIGAALAGEEGLAIGVLARRGGMHPTTLNRDLKPLIARGLVTDARDPSDGRIRTVLLTKKGRAKWREALPLWRRAQSVVERAVGGEEALSLNAMLDAAFAKLAAPTVKRGRSEHSSR
jgi:DNA-binding MarR family transcriptional regulator